MKQLLILVPLFLLAPHAEAKSLKRFIIHGAQAPLRMESQAKVIRHMKRSRGTVVEATQEQAEQMAKETGGTVEEDTIISLIHPQ